MPSSLLALSGQNDPRRLLPEGWIAKQLGGTCDIFAGGRLGLTKEKDYQATGVVAFSAAGPDGFVEQAEVKGKDGVILSAIGANCGRCFFASGDWTTLANVQAIIPRDEIDSKYLFYYVNRDNYWERSGSAQPFIKPSSVHSSWIVYPANRTEQSKIAEVLSTVDRAIEQTEALIAKQQRIKAGLMHDLLTRGIDEHGNLRSEATHKFKDSPLGRIPVEWEVVPLFSCISVSEGQKDPKREPYRNWILVAPDHIESGSGRLISTSTAQEQGAISGKYEFQPGDIVYSKIRPYLRKAILANFTGLCSADMYPLRPKNGVRPEFIFATILGESFSRYAESVSERSGFPKINRKELSEFILALPSEKEQERIGALSSVFDETLYFNHNCLSKLRRLKSALMQDLLTGRRRVTALLNEQDGVGA